MASYNSSESIKINKEHDRKQYKLVSIPNEKLVRPGVGLI